MGGGKGEKGKMNGAQIELCILLCLVYVSWGLTDSIQVVPAKNLSTGIRFPPRLHFTRLKQRQRAQQLHNMDW